MKFSNANGCAERRRRAGFTFVEILIAMMFLALVLPIAVHGIRLSSDAGTLAHRKADALRLGESLLNEMVVTEEWRTATGGGQFEPPWQDYQWQLETGNWSETGMLELRLRVGFRVRELPYEVQLTTLVPEAAESAAGTEL